VLLPIRRPAVEVTKMPGIAHPLMVLPVTVRLRWAPAGATRPLPPVASIRMGTPPHELIVLLVMTSSLLLPASSHQYSGDTRMADIRLPSNRFPVISP